MDGCNSNCTTTSNDDASSKPLPYVGLYITAASLLCALGMSFDVGRGFHKRRFWFPSKLFRLNAITITLLAVATKFPVDLNTSMPGHEDQLSKLTGTVLICTVMGNFMPSIGAMIDTDIIANIVALGIFVFTVIVNVGIQMGTGVIFFFVPEQTVIMFFMVALFVILVSSGVAVSTSKKLLQDKFELKMKQIREERKSLPNGIFKIDKLEDYVNKFWLMAHTSEPQYVIGRSVTCTASGFFCLLAAFVLVEAIVRSSIGRSNVSSSFSKGHPSDYKWSTRWVLVVQAFAIVAGTIGPAIRWFNAISFRSPQENGWSCKEEFKVEEHWVNKLKEWKESPLENHIKMKRMRRTAHNLKKLTLTVLMILQVQVVQLSKIIRLVSILPVNLLNKCSRFKKKLQTLSRENSEDLEGFVLFLEGEKQLVDMIMRSGGRDTYEWIKKGNRNKPNHLVRLFDHSRPTEGFPGAYYFNGIIIQTDLGDIHNCWALPIVTLASIAVALPGDGTNDLLKGVFEGLKYVKLVEKNLDCRGLKNMRDEADQNWNEVDLYSRWYDIDLNSTEQEENNCKPIIERLRQAAKKIVDEFQQRQRDSKEETRESRDLPGKVLAANYMYRVTQTILNEQGVLNREDLFDSLRKMIADILAACLTNLPQVIYMECFCCPVEEREERVRSAALLFGETKDLLEEWETHETKGKFPKNNKEYIESWRPTCNPSPEQPICSNGALNDQSNMVQTTCYNESKPASDQVSICIN